jgi:hypothetical protein
LTGFTDAGLASGTSYYYQLVAVDSSGPSASSIEVSALTAVVANGTSGNDAVTLKQNGDHLHIDWAIGANVGQVPIGSAAGLAINGNGGSDTIILDYTNGNPVPNSLHLNGSFTINNLQGTNPLVGTTLEIGKSTVYIGYSTFDPIAAIQSYLQNGYNGGSWNGTSTPTTGVITSTAVQLTSGYMIGYADSADGVVAGQPPDTIELKYTLGGDLNLSGTVNFSNFALLIANYGKPAAWDGGAITYGNTVSFFDFALLVANYGKQAVTTVAADPAPAETQSNALSTLRQLNRRRSR